MESTILEQKLQNVQASGGTKMNVSDFLLKQLAAWGVKRIYGVIGDANLYLLDELSKQDQIQYIACRHECGSALMASAEAKLTGRLSVCLATSGPGIANLLNGLADASMDHTRVLAITGQVETNKIGTRSKQYIDQQKFISPITEHSYLLIQANALPQVIKQCLVQSSTGGSVSHLSIPKDLYQQTVEGEIYLYEPHLHQKLHAPVKLVKEMAQMIAGAQRPVLLIGRGIYGVTGPLKELAEMITAAVVSTMPARSLFPNDHPLYAGGLGQAGSEAASRLLAESDLIVILGATWWPEDYVPGDKPIIQVDKKAKQIGLKHPVSKGVVGDLKAMIPQLLLELKGMAEKGFSEKSISGNRQEWADRVSFVNREWRVRIEQEAHFEGSPIPPQRVIKAISDNVKEDAVIALDTGDHTLWFNRIFQSAGNQDILVSGRWRTLGFGLPAAIAAQLEFPNRQVVAIVGDGGVIQTLMEFQTAVEHHLPIVVIILNNGSYAMEKNRMEQSGLNTFGSRLVNPDFAMIAQACGGLGLRAETAEELEACLRDAFHKRQPTIIDVLTADALVPHTKI
ncbi:MAG TPA: thiamine pyrophosphate-binding protein [Bacilli bacterium]